MGVYDTIVFKCPSCGVELYAQSKSGACSMADYTIDSVPLSVANDANRHAPFQCDCGKKWFLTVEGDLPEEIKIPMKVMEWPDDESTMDELLKNEGENDG